MGWSDPPLPHTYFLPPWLWSLCVLSILCHLCGYSCPPIPMDIELIPPLPTPALLSAPGSPPWVRPLGLPPSWISTWEKQGECDGERSSHMWMALKKLFITL